MPVAIARLGVTIDRLKPSDKAAVEKELDTLLAKPEAEVANWEAILSAFRLGLRRAPNVTRATCGITSSTGTTSQSSPTSAVALTIPGNPGAEPVEPLSRSLFRTTTTTGSRAAGFLCARFPGSGTRGRRSLEWAS
jgi:hypothetical protein